MIQEETPAVPENRKEISIKRVCLGKVSWTCVSENGIG